MNVLMSASVVAFLGVAVITDTRTHRIPNTLVLFGLAFSLALQAGFYQLDGLLGWMGGITVGLVCFLPLYMFGGMAAGDVKLMSMIGGFLGPLSAFWASTFSLIAGGAVGILILLNNKQLIRFFRRYKAILTFHTYIQAEADDVSRQPFPYAIAILLGTLTSVFWPHFASRLGG